MTEKQLIIAETEFIKRKKSRNIGYVLWFMSGIIGGHRYYAGDLVRGIFMTLTLGGLGIWAFIDLFFIGKRIDEKNEEIEKQVLVELEYEG
jgi:TM2 domain-containing membrane protein YozV